MQKPRRNPIFHAKFLNLRMATSRIRRDGNIRLTLDGTKHPSHWPCACVVIDTFSAQKIVKLACVSRR